MSGIAAALVLIGVTVLVGLVVWVLLEPVRIDRTCDRFDYGLTDDDAPRDDNDWPPVLRDLDDVARDFGVDLGRPPRRINGDT